MARPLIGLVCCNESVDRPIQSVATRFLDPLARIAGLSVMLVPALTLGFDGEAIASRLDGLMLTGSRTHVAPWRYGGPGVESERMDVQRDAVALRLAGRMIDAGRPVFGICRGLQELNVLFGGTLGPEAQAGTHHAAADDPLPFGRAFAHRHDVAFPRDGLFARATGRRRLRVNSVHEQTIDTLGDGLRAEAIAADDGVIEAFSAPQASGEVLAVQWHPEWDDCACPSALPFYRMIGLATRGATLHEAARAARPELHAVDPIAALNSPLPVERPSA